MKKTFLSISLLAALCSAPLICDEVVAVAKATTEANTDLKAILHKTFLGDKAEPFLNMMAADAIHQSGKEMNPADLVVKFKEAFDSDETFGKLAAPYKAIFSDSEIHQLKEILCMPVFEKYSLQGTEAFQSNFITIQETIKDLAVKLGTEKKAVEAASNVIEVTQENFKSVVEDSKKPVVIDFYSTTCPPCRMMEPVMKELSVEHDSVLFVKINCDEQQELAAKYEIKQLPTLLFIKPGEKAVSMKTTGFTSKNDMNTKLAEFTKE